MDYSRILVTGAAGFIGSNFVHLSLQKWPETRIIALDKIGYAGSRQNLAGLANPESLEFVEGNVADEQLMRRLVKEVDGVVHFAAESMVDRSVIDGRPFVESNVLGTYTLLDAIRHHGDVRKILHISTPEVYGERTEAPAAEGAAIAPRNIYAATKAGAEMLISAFRQSFGLPIVITRGSNAIGPRQHLEKVLPQWIARAMDDQNILVYGDGKAVRDWIHVQDMNAANDLVLRNAAPGEAFNILTGTEHSLRELAEGVLKRLGKPLSLIQSVGERPGHDLRYHMAVNKLAALGWAPQYSFDETLDETVQWYIDNESWWRPIQQSQEFQSYMKANLAGKRSK